MTQLLSFSAKGAFAAFKDPSVTTNQMAYFVPSKSAVVGMIGAILGVSRSNALGEIYEEPYIDLYADTRIGIRLESDPSKVTFYTNHRSSKHTMKPTKVELLENPHYTIFVETKEGAKLYNAIKNHSPAYTPYLGHAYCPAVLSDPCMADSTPVDDPNMKQTDCVVLDESGLGPEPDEYSEFTLMPAQNSSIIVERHLHHYVADSAMHRRVLRHWIPKGAACRIRGDARRSISKFYDLGGKVVCMY